VLSRCSFQIDSTSAYGNKVGASGRRRCSTRWAKSQTIAQSARASPGAGTAARTRLMRRSLLVTVPAFSPQRLAGNSKCA
jgi:hypothetical protein